MGKVKNKMKNTIETLKQDISIIENKIDDLGNEWTEISVPIELEIERLQEKLKEMRVPYDDKETAWHIKLDKKNKYFNLISKHYELLCKKILFLTPFEFKNYKDIKNINVKKHEVKFPCNWKIVDDDQIKYFNFEDCDDTLSDYINEHCVGAQYNCDAFHEYATYVENYVDTHYPTVELEILEKCSDVGSGFYSMDFFEIKMIK